MASGIDRAACKRQYIGMEMPTEKWINTATTSMSNDLAWPLFIRPQQRLPFHVMQRKATIDGINERLNKCN